ncbi:MAG: ArnT family glycosyltransferase [Anaerolineales bacterium]
MAPLVTRQPMTRTTLALIILVCTYLALGNVYSATTPPFEKPDEEGHYAYVAHIVRLGQLPPLVKDAALNPAQQIAGHAPLYYALSAGLVRVLGLEVSAPLPPINPFWAYPAPGTRPDNKNRFVHSANEDYRAVWVLRLFSLALGAATIPLAFALALELTHERLLALLTASLITLHPQYLFIAGSVSNDALVTSFSTAALWMLLRVLPRPNEWRPWLLFGGLAGLATLAKTNAILLPVLGAAVAVWLAWQRRDVSVAVKGVTASRGGWLLLAGGWYLRNSWFYADPLGVGIHALIFPRGAPLTLADVPLQLSIVSTTFWAAFAWTNVSLPGWAYWGWRVMEVLALIGLAGVSVRLIRNREHGLRFAIVLIYAAGVSVGLVWWSAHLQGTLGRLLFPALAALMLLMVLGLRRLWRGLPYASAIYMGTMTLLGPLYILPAYQPPALLTELSSAFERTQFTTGDFARLVGYTVSTRALAPGGEVTVTLCWEALTPTSRPYSVFVQLVGGEMQVVGARNTYPGLGRYPTTHWRAKTQFCDDVTVRSGAETPSPAVYDLQVGMFDLETGARPPVADVGGQPVPVIELGSIKAEGFGRPAPATARPVDALFSEPITLRAYELAPLHVGQTSELHLYWEATGKPSADYTVFVHVLDPNGKLVAQADAPPQSAAHAGLYSTDWWEAGEHITDSHRLALPADMLPGAYRLRVGLYQLQTGQRVGLASGMDSVELGDVNVAP